VIFLSIRSGLLCFSCDCFEIEEPEQVFVNVIGDRIVKITVGYVNDIYFEEKYLSFEIYRVINVQKYILDDKMRFYRNKKLKSDGAIFCESLKLRKKDLSFSVYDQYIKISNNNSSFAISICNAHLLLTALTIVHERMNNTIEQWNLSE